MSNALQTHNNNITLNYNILYYYKKRARVSNCRLTYWSSAFLLIDNDVAAGWYKVAILTSRDSRRYGVKVYK